VYVPQSVADASAFLAGAEHRRLPSHSVAPSAADPSATSCLTAVHSKLFH